MLIKDLVVGACYKNVRNYGRDYVILSYSHAVYSSDDIVEFYFHLPRGGYYVIPCEVPAWANEVAEINVEPITSLEQELM